MSKHSVSIMDSDKELEEQQYDITELRKLLKDTREEVNSKEKKIEEVSAKFSRFQLESKAKVASLNLKLQMYEKASKKDNIDPEDSSNTDTSGQHAKGRVLFLKKQLNASKILLDKKDKEIEDICKGYEHRILNLETQLNEQGSVNISKNVREFDQAANKNFDEISTKELYAQIVLKDSKILDLNNELIECEKKVLDLQENVKEKNEVLKSRDDAVKLMSANMSCKVKDLVDQLEETRHQMQVMQKNFTDNEAEWKHKTSVLELAAQKFTTESIAELQDLTKALEDEKLQVKVLQSALDEATNQPELKAKETERVKLKASEDKLDHSKHNDPELVSELMQHIAFLEEEHGRLQLQILESNDILRLNSHLETENSKLHGHLKENEEILCQYKQKIEQILEDKDLEMKKLQTNCNSISEKNVRLTQALDEVNKIKRNLEDQIFSLEKHIGTLKANDDLLEEEVAVLKDEKIELEMKVIELEEICEGSEEQSKEFHRRINDFLQGSTVSSEQQTPLSQIEAFIEQMVLIKSEHNLLASENTKLHNECKSLSKCLKDSEQVMLGLNNNMENYENELTKKDRELASLRSSIKLFQEDIATMFATVKVQNMEDFFCKWNSQIQELNAFKTVSTEEKVIQCDMERKENMSIALEAKRLQTLIYDIKNHYEEEINKLSRKLQKEENQLGAINSEVQILTELLKEKEKQLSDQTVQVWHLLMPYQQHDDLWADTKNIMKLVFKDGILNLKEKLKCNHEMLNKMAAEVKQGNELYEGTVEKCNYYMNALSLHKEKHSQLILPIMDVYNSFFSSGHLTSPPMDEITAVQKIKQLLYNNKDKITSMCSQNEMLMSKVTELTSLSENAVIYNNSLKQELETHFQATIACSKKATQSLLILCNEKVHIQEDFEELRNAFQNFAITTVKTLSNLNVEVNKKLQEAAENIYSLNAQMKVKKTEIHFLENKLQEKEQQINVLDAELEKRNDEHVKHEEKLEEIESLTLEVGSQCSSATSTSSEFKKQTQIERQAYISKKSAVAKKLSHLKDSVIHLMEFIKILKNENMAIKQMNENLKAELDKNKRFLVVKEIMNKKLREELDFQKINQENKDSQAALSNLLIEKNMLEKHNHALNDELQSSNSKYMNLMDVYAKEKALCDENSDKITCYQKTIFDLENQKGNLDVELHEQNQHVRKLDAEICKLLDEKDILKSELSQEHLHYEQLQNKYANEKDISSSSQAVHAKSFSTSEQKCDLISSHIHPEAGVSHCVSSKIAIIHQRLPIEEKQAFGVFQGSSNELDSALNVKNEQGMTGCELQYANERFNSGDEATENEYRLLLGDPDQPEMFIEKDFSITREVKTRAHAFQRWFRSQRNCLIINFRRRKYFDFLLIIYLCAIHVWLLLCLNG